VRSIIPELKDSAFADATVRQVMDMTASFRYSEDYNDPQADVWVYSAAGSPFPKPSDFQGPRTYYEYLLSVQGEGKHGEAFAYKTPNTDVLGWIIVRSTGTSFADLLSERIWSRMGAEQSAFITVDSVGTPFVGGGLNCGLRDLARVGQLMLNQGVIDGRRLFPRSVTESIQRGADKQAFAKAGYETLKGGSYRSMWWVLHNDHAAFAARGVHGQTIYVDPKANMVIARFASHPQAKNAAIDPTSLPAYEAIAEHLMRK
jgi:CubicO group peptidase (beta-lactamase class C family)